MIEAPGFKPFTTNVQVNHGEQREDRGVGALDRRREQPDIDPGLVRAAPARRQDEAAGRRADLRERR